MIAPTLEFIVYLYRAQRISESAAHDESVILKLSV